MTRPWVILHATTTPFRTLKPALQKLRARLYCIPPTGQDDALPLSLISGHYDKWQRWAEQELAQLNIQLARLRAQKEEIVTQARLAFGRQSATETLLDRQKAEKRNATVKRFELDLSNDVPGKKSLFF